MEAKYITLNEDQPEPFEFTHANFKMYLSNVFSNRNGYLNELHLFVANFNAIPNLISEIKINCKKAHRWFSETYRAEIKDCHYFKRHFEHNSTAELDEIYYFIYDDLIIHFEIESSAVRFLFRKTDPVKVAALIFQIKKFKLKKERSSPEISLLVTTSLGIEAKNFKILKSKLNIESNYNEDFKEIHQTILKRLSKKNDKGLVLLHGKPGTGKTSYIRYLISSLKKDVIFLPPNMANAITNPDLLSVLIDNPNSIFVIEDAENIVIDREKDGHSPVSALLNISDGLLSDCLNIQIICSFNTDISKIDSALLRKGRLIAKYEFKELEVQKAQALSTKLGFSAFIHSPMTLTDIYNQEERDFQQIKSRNAIGFSMVEAN